MKNKVFAYTVPQGVVVPVLESDKLAFERYGHALTTWGRRERRIVANLVAYMNSNGFTCSHVDDGGDHPEKVNDTREIMEAAFAVDDATLLFRDFRNPPDKHQYEVNLVFGNGNDGLDVIADHSTGGRFGEVMDQFDHEVFA
jgi:hypothetical protein